MYELIGTGVGALSLGAIVGYLIGHVRGMADKLEELHVLQEDGWLTISYTEERPLQSDKRPTQSDNSIYELLYKNEDDIGRVSHTRRDNEARRVDWARSVNNADTNRLRDDT